MSVQTKSNMMTSRELKEVLELHRKWINKEAGGVRAVIQNRTLDAMDLSGADLRGATFKKVRFSGTDLRDVDLRGANLQGSYFASAHMEGANLVGVKAKGANFNGTFLKGADLSGSDLTDTIFRNAYLKDACLLDCIIEGADFSIADFSAAELPSGVYQVSGCGVGSVVYDSINDKVSCVAWGEEGTWGFSNDCSLESFKNFVESNKEALYYKDYANLVKYFESVKGAGQ